MLAFGAMSAGAGPGDGHRNQAPPAIANTAAAAAIGMAGFIPRDGAGGGAAAGAGVTAWAIERAGGSAAARAVPATGFPPGDDMGEVSVAPGAAAGLTRTVASSSISGGIPASS